MMISLNNAYYEFSHGSLGREPFIVLCCEFVRELFSRSVRARPEESHEALAEFYPRLCTLPERYRDQGSSFEAYVTVSFRFFYRTRRNVHRRRRMLEVLVPEIDEILSVAESSVFDRVEDPAFEPDPAVVIETAGCLCNTRLRDTIRRQILIVFCKNLPLLDDEETRRYARALQIPMSFVNAVRSYIDDRNAPLLARRCFFRTQRDRHYVQMNYAETLVLEEPDSAVRLAATKRYRFHRRRWAHYRKRLDRIKIHLSHQEIGSLLGIPKGTVDSAVSRLNRRLELLRGSRYPDADADDSSCFQQRA